MEFQGIKNKTENVFRPILQNALNSTHVCHAHAGQLRTSLELGSETIISWKADCNKYFLQSCSIESYFSCMHNWFIWLQVYALYMDMPCWFSDHSTTKCTSFILMVHSIIHNNNQDHYLVFLVNIKKLVHNNF